MRCCCGNIIGGYWGNGLDNWNLALSAGCAAVAARVPLPGLRGRCLAAGHAAVQAVCRGMILDYLEDVWKGEINLHFIGRFMRR